MLKIIFYIKTDKVNKNGESPIFAKISYRSKSTTLSTGKSITKDRWEATNRLRNVLKIEKEKVLRNSLDLFALEIEKKFNDLLKTDLESSLFQLKEHLTGKSIKKGLGILELFEMHNVSFGRRVDTGDRSTASLQKYSRAKHLLKSYIAKYYNRKDMSIELIDGAFVFNLESFLRYESRFKDKIGIKNNSVVKYFRNFKTICHYGIKMELIDKNPFLKYDGKLKIKEAVFLSQDELRLIENREFTNNRLSKVRDIFLFSCYTGYAPIDATKLTYDDIVEDNYGNQWILTTRTKTSIKTNVPILPPTLRIIQKYKDQQSGLIPKLSNQKMNSYLKEIADVCGIQKNLTWYVARHTFATTITLANGVRIENVSAMLGHTNIKQTQHYAKVLDASVMEDMTKLKDLYK